MIFQSVYFAVARGGTRPAATAGTVESVVPHF